MNEMEAAKEARMNKFQEGLQQQRKLVEQLRLEAAVPRVRVSECIEDIMKYCEQHTSEDVLINGFLRPGDNPYKEKGGCTIL
ncbi:guanine nucleotide-binding protein subunit gamma-1-like isoform X1 [Ruditapes philippinarum]|uniref:guanine nucleotide-binding protein subunit gamma-1-like isoform X1 n=1 Tax=Ruditapes philippinarum TaxID=129788 RepID=UPI00295BC86E|nr:guanine nucleotide-binding protein subunit gamma-1-like isoform X1 [Ruditapes philippinarum]